MKRTLLATCLAACAGCVSTVRPPAEPEDPVTVYVLSRALHSGIVLPAADGEHVEYGYGEWSWYARGRQRWYHVFGTLLWPTAGTLGRRSERGDEREALERALGAKLAPLVVSRARVEALLLDLDRRHRTGAGTQIESPEHRMSFVRAERGFWLFHNCHDASAGWLRRLDCRVSRVPLRTGLTIRERRLGRDLRAACRARRRGSALRIACR